MIAKAATNAVDHRFILQREFPNWDTQLLEGRIRTLLASLVSKGDVEDITDIKLAFSATHTHVIVTPPHTSVMNKFLSFVKANRNFAVVKAVWPYANTAKETRNDVPRQCAVQSEDGWWQMWGPIIAMAVKTRKSGWLGVENVMDMVMNSRIQRSTC